MLRSPIFSGVPNKGDKIGIGYLTSALSRAQNRVELLWNSCILGGPQQRGQHHKWLPHPSLLGGAQEGGIRCNCCILDGPQQRVTWQFHTLVGPREGRGIAPTFDT